MAILPFLSLPTPASLEVKFSDNGANELTPFLVRPLSQLQNLTLDTGYGAWRLQTIDACLLPTLASLSLSGPAEFRDSVIAIVAAVHPAISSPISRTLHLHSWVFMAPDIQGFANSPPSAAFIPMDNPRSRPAVPRASLDMFHAGASFPSLGILSVEEDCREDPAI
ncbi:hypothetical protein B0H17DRAFT_1193355 [Mycena rosella]|uniref:Uncharacterized protein n=1 Tax=Mycena rosella TaxID=1033263 RepID=A0AAD7GTG0_MYCRO|nr:hypothetical protein B0H17DRAFT_1193355 [Mycena rosella]